LGIIFVHLLSRSGRVYGERRYKFLFVIQAWDWGISQRSLECGC